MEVQSQGRFNTKKKKTTNSGSKQKKGETITPKRRKRYFKYCCKGCSPRWSLEELNIANGLQPGDKQV